MRKISLLLAFLVFTGINILYAQNVQVTGTVSSAEDGSGIPGATVKVKGGTSGVVTDVDGKYSISVSSDATLVFSFVGTKTQEIPVAGQKVINVTLKQEAVGLDEVVVTALGIKREKKALGYSVQEVGKDLNDAKESNFVNALSGKVSGVQIKQSSTMGGSANIVIRGNKSLLGSNQAMFVIDGVPVDNSMANSTDVAAGRGGYDFGNAAADVNSEDIESVSVLKGAAATALYGSRAANGVVLITTKKGSAKKGVGVSINSGILFTSADKSTLPKIQKEYGAGYGQYFDYMNVNGVKTAVVPTYDDASWGNKFDPNLQVLDWVGLDPLDTKNYLKTVPWVAAKHDIRDFFETGAKYTNNIAVEGANDKGVYRFSYTNTSEKGIMPNSKMDKNTANFSSSYNFNKNFSVESNVSYTNDDNKGRYGTGYDPGNPMQSIGQWFQTNVDIYDLKKYYINPDGSQRTWNYGDPTNGDFSPIYHNNIYWTRNVNYETDGRNRFFGYVNPKLKLTSWATLEGRVSVDYYSGIQEERIAVGSNQTSMYSKYLDNFIENNYDLMLKLDHKFGDFSTNGLFGVTKRRTELNSTYASTVGGLAVAGFYSLSASKSPVTTTERDLISGCNSVYGDVSIGYNNTFYLDGSLRADKNSTLLVNHNVFYYPAASGSVILSEFGFLKNIEALSFAKLRVNYAEVGNGTDPYKLFNAYDTNTNWGNIGVYSLPVVIYNQNLKPERTKSWEAGLEANFFQKRIGFDLSLYKTNSVNQIMPVNISRASGWSQRYVNSGEIENKGIELALNATPVKIGDFAWDVHVNWTKNVNKVLSLYEGVDNILLSSSWDVSLNLVKGKPYGILRGSDFVYTNGQRTVGTDGHYLYQTNVDGSTKTDCELGSVQPDWTGGISNTFSYKGLSLYFLIDISTGGKIYSVDQKYGVSTGLYAETAGLNDKGVAKRDDVANGGGIRYNAVNADGSKNTTYIDASTWGTAWDYDQIPTAGYVYDASYIKLREVSLSYTLPGTLVAKTPFTKVTAAAVGRNLWIIHKNTPFFDPETSQSAGNIQGISDGAYPAARTLGFNISLSF